MKYPKEIEYTIKVEAGSGRQEEWFNMMINAIWLATLQSWAERHKKNKIIKREKKDSK